jgi:dUTP pyrophosphatase
MVSLLCQPNKIIPTGLFFSIPENFEIQIRPRSGHKQNGVTVLNTPGTIDADLVRVKLF